VQQKLVMQQKPIAQKQPSLKQSALTTPIPEHMRISGKQKVNENRYMYGKEFQCMSLQYQGDDMPLSLMFGEQYVKKNDCQGWCRLPEHRRVAMCVFCDMSKDFGVAIRSD